MIRSHGMSSDKALHREAVVVSCWDRPCKLAALMNLMREFKRRLMSKQKGDNYGVYSKLKWLRS